MTSFRYPVRSLSLLTLLLLMLTARPTAVQAQSRIRNGLIFGGVGAQIDGDQMGGYHKAGITGGLSSTIQASDRWNVRLEVVYIQKGSRSQSRDSAFYINPITAAGLPPAQQQALLALAYQQQPGAWLRYRLNYVQMPVLIEYRAHPKITVYAGASLDYLLRATADYGYGYTQPLGAPFRRTDVMGHAGVDLSLGERWSVTMRLMYSMRDISTQGLGTDRYLFWTGRLGGYRNNLLSTTLRFYLSDTPKFKGTPLFRRATPDGSQPTDPSLNAPTGTDDGEPTTP